MYPFLYFRAVKTLNNYELSGSTLLAQITEKVIFLSILSRVAKKILDFLDWHWICIFNRLYFNFRLRENHLTLTSAKTLQTHRQILRKK